MAGVARITFYVQTALDTAVVEVVVLVMGLVVGLVVRFAAALDVDFAFVVAAGAAMLIDDGLAHVVVARSAVLMLDVVLLDSARSATYGVVLDPRLALLGYPPRAMLASLDPDLPLVPVRSFVVPHVDVDVHMLVDVHIAACVVAVVLLVVFMLLVLLVLFVGLLARVRLDGGEVSDNLGQAGVGDGDLLLAVLELLLLAQQPVDAVAQADTATVVDVARYTLGVRGDVLQGAAHVAHGTVHPLGLFGVRFESIVDFLDGEQTAHFVEVLREKWVVSNRRCSHVVSDILTERTRPIKRT